MYKYYLCTLTDFCVFQRKNKLFCCVIEKVVYICTNNNKQKITL